MEGIWVENKRVVKIVERVGAGVREAGGAE